MRVDLAYPYTDDKGKVHAPDSTVDLDEPLAKQMIRDGYARPSATKKAAAQAPKKTQPSKRTPSPVPDSGADKKEENS